MLPRNTYKVLSETYDTLYTEVNASTQVPFSPDELKILTSLFDFKLDKDNAAHLRRLPAAGEIEDLIKYSDNSFVLLQDTGRPLVRKEYTDFYELVQHLASVYKADMNLYKAQTPRAPENPQFMG